MTSIRAQLKPLLARWLKHPLLTWFMRLGIAIVVARHRVGVVAVPLAPDGRVLLLEHVFHPYAPWGLPGGWLGRGEEPAAAALRELEEETGLTGSIGPLLYLERAGHPDHMTLAFLVHVTPQAVQLSHEILSARWCQPDALPGPRYNFTDEAIAAALRMQRALDLDQSATQAD